MKCCSDNLFFCPFLNFAGGLWWAHKMEFSMPLLPFPKMGYPLNSLSKHSHKQIKKKIPKIPKTT